MKTKPLFDPEVFLTRVVKGKTQADYRKNHKIFSQGDPAESVFYVQKGRVKLTVISKDGKEAVIAILGPGDFFGEGCLAGQLLRMSTAIALSESAIIRLEKAGVVRALHDNPAFFRAVSPPSADPQHSD